MEEFPQQPPPQESQESMETPSETEMREDTARLCNELARLGEGSPEVRQMMINWMDHWDARVTAEKDNKRLSTYRNIQIARLYLNAGDRETALEYLDDARNQAQQEGQEDLYERIMVLLSEI